jgi:DNA modification methylase
MMAISIVKADCLEFLRSQPEGSLDLVFGSPPYSEARLYLEGGENLGISRKTDAWVAWMVEVFQAAQRACKGLVAFVVAGQTRNYKWSAGPALLMAELHRAGMNLRNPPIFSRVGIPGSGGPDWLRGDYEWIICTTRPGQLPWSDNTACGHPPKWAPGGEASHRLTNGTRVNQWGKTGVETAVTGGDGEKPKTEGTRPSHKMRTKGGSPKDGICPKNRDKWGSTGHATGGEGRKANGEHKTRPGKKKKTATAGHVNGDTGNNESYDPPAIANPGNIIDKTYTTAEVAELMGEVHDRIHCNVGGGVMAETGAKSKLASENEAPFPEKLAELFILSFCPPGGFVCDPFSGSGTVAAVSKRHNRNFTGCDLRQSQVDKVLKRLDMETPMLFS